MIEFDELKAVLAPRKGTASEAQHEKKKEKRVGHLKHSVLGKGFDLVRRFLNLRVVPSLLCPPYLHNMPW